MVRAYAITSGTVFGLIVGAHVLRVIYEGPRLVTDPAFMFLTAVSAALCAWGMRVGIKP